MLSNQKNIRTISSSQMFHPSPKIQSENTIANKMLVEGLKNTFVKDILQNIANTMRQEILNPLLEATSGLNQFNEITSDEFRHIIFHLATMHSNEERQYGGLLRDKFKDSTEIISNMKHVETLLTALDQAIADISGITQPDKFIQALKVIVDLGNYYTQFLPGLHTPHFESIYNLIFPSPEEFKVRISTKELGIAKQRSMTFGIGREKGEVISAEEDTNQVGYYAGKSTFLDVDFKRRLKLMAAEYDLIFLDENEDSRLLTLQKFYEEVKNHFGTPLTEEFKKYQGNASSQMDFATWGRKMEPQSIKLARAVGLPLVASVSGSTARTLIALQDLHAFDINGEFCPDIAQVLANCIMAFFIKAGHHSFYEVAESYNRILDYILLNSVKTSAETTMNAYYFKVGDYHSFLHKKYADKIVASGCDTRSTRFLSKL